MYCVCGWLCSGVDGCYVFCLIFVELYLILYDGFVGVMFDVFGCYLWCFVYLYFMIEVCGYEMLIMYVFCDGDCYFDFDVVFGVCLMLVVDWVWYVFGIVFDGLCMDMLFYMFDYDFVLNCVECVV